MTVHGDVYANTTIHAYDVKNERLVFVVYVYICMRAYLNMMMKVKL